MNRFTDGGTAEVADGGAAGAGAPKEGEGVRPRGRLRDRLAQRARTAALAQEAGGMASVLGPDGKPLTVHMAAGLGKQRLYVIPQYDMVVVRFAEYTRAGADFSNAEFLGRLLGVKTP
jgi:hypothetical protein